ncbi:MAG: formate dehydrogenase accessory sulfurtransferase FdhD [Akkermansiaceae bacterium]|jgi:FdhD protein|nr:formate dehydrogenase accessory sulfurtransferase FdhD [Akkermansiaceae bacterium]
MPDESAEYQICKQDGSSRRSEVDHVAREEPLQITVDGTPVAVVMRTPGHDEDLVRGFLITEGIVDNLNYVSRIDLEQKQNHAYVFLTDDVMLDQARLSRNLYSASSCGICGKASIDSIRQSYPPLEDGFLIHEHVLLGLSDALRSAQQIFLSTGGLHAAALMDAAGQVLVLREDVGRHNAMDKVIGCGSVDGIDFSNTLLQLSGRVSFEVMQKALAVGIPMVSAISAPTSLAVDFARESNQTLVGFLRPPSYNVYAGEERVSVS